MSNISFEKIWEDEEMFEIEILVKNEYISAKKTCYLQQDSLIEFSNFTSDFVSNSAEEKKIKWGISLENGNTECEFSILPMNKQGHIFINISMVQVEGQYYNTTSLYIETEIGLLESFGKNIFSHLEKVGNKICLNLEQ
ncbi:hypothetical protein RyT2_09530 [Pseudolactococcus yaeyamensis]